MLPTKPSPGPDLSFFSLSPDLMNVLDLAGYIRNANPAHATLLGYAPEELVGQHYTAIMHPDDVPYLQSKLMTLREHGVVRDVSARGYDAWGQIRCFEISSQLVAEDAIYSVARDITESQELTAAKHRLEHKLTLTLNSMTDAVFMLDQDWRFTFINRVGERTLETTAEAILGRSLWACFPAALGTEFEARYRHAMASGETASFEAFFEPLNLWVEVNAYPGPDGLAVYFRKINDRVFAQRHMSLLERSISATMNGVLIVDVQMPDQPIIFVNPAFERITGFSSAEAVGRNCRFLQGPQTSDALRGKMRKAIAEEREAHVILANYRKDGAVFWNELYIAPVKDEQERVTHYIGILNDISTLQETREQLAWNTHHDALTGLPNRSLLMERLQQALAMQTAGRPGVGLMVLDLDRFRQFYEFMGQDQTGHLVQQLVQRMQKILSKADTLARLDTDEFAVLFGPAARTEIQAVAHRVLQAVRRPVHIQDEAFQVTASAGLRISSEPGHAAPDVLRQTEMALYHAKQGGCNQVVEYQPGMDEPLARRNALRRGLQSALTSRNQFALKYQPQINASTGQVIGVEVLIRWEHPEFGVIPPDQFIPLAETSGLIGPVTDWVVARLITEMPKLVAWCSPDMRFGINVSPILLRDNRFAERLTRAFDNAGIDARRIEIELTESVLVDASEDLNKLRKSGFRIAIDDFGTGATGLSYLKDLPVDTLKIDRTFVHNIVMDDRDSTIVDSVVYLARHMKMTVIAEGVENAAQVRHLARAGVHVFQGYFFAEPMNLHDLWYFLTDRGPRPGYVNLPEVPAAMKPRLLLVDDDVSTRNALERLFRRSQVDLLAVATHEEALLELSLREYRVLLCDLGNRSAVFMAFLDTVSRRYPDIRIIVLSGSVSVKVVTDAINTGALYRYLTKPWSDPQLMEVVYEALAAPVVNEK